MIRSRISLATRVAQTRLDGLAAGRSSHVRAQRDAAGFAGASSSYLRGSHCALSSVASESNKAAAAAIGAVMGNFGAGMRSAKMDPMAATPAGKEQRVGSCGGLAV